MPERVILLQRRLFFITIGLSILVICAFAFAGYSLKVAQSNTQTAQRQARHDRLDLCEAQNRSNMALRRILLLAEQLVRKAHNVPPPEKLRSVAFYQKALSFVKPLDCQRLAGST